jgi:hypothetical protein
VAISAEQLARELRAFDGRREIVKALRRALTRVSRPAVKEVRAHAVDILPAGGGLGAWVAAARIGVKIGYTSRSAGVKMRGGRKSLTDKSDLQRIDAGTVRAPTYGHRGRGSWHSQSVAPGWWTDPLANNADWQAQADAEIDKVLDQIRNG